VTTFLVGLCTTLILTGVSIPLLRRARVVDVPNPRSSHTDAIPRGGGIAVLVGVCVAAAFGGSDSQLVAVLVSAILAGLLGLADDVADLSAVQRLAVQLVLGASLSGLLLLHRTESPVLLVGGVAVATLWLVGYLNAFNFMDGINGISGLSAAVAGAWYAWVGHDLGVVGLSTAGLALAGAGVGFLPWNVPRPRVFLGDVGSYGLGMLIAALGLISLLEGASVMSAVAPSVIYLADTAWVLIKRVRRGDSWREAHREHVYQRLVDAGLGHVGVASAVALLALLLAVAAALLPSLAAAPTALAVAGGYLMLPRLVSRRRQKDLVQ
jgi:UDP-GlcNAc:undecaprenyl-phosphate/decaprenyl-phosphate GlcNAc-1-phosphate transferase